MAARYDKYEPKAGGFRAQLNADTSATTTLPLGVGLNSSGKVVVGAGQTGVIGVVVLNKDMLAGDVVDVMTSGEVVDCSGLVAGTAYTANTTTGVISSAAASATQTPVGFTAEATRLVVRRSIQPYIGT